MLNFNDINFFKFCDQRKKEPIIDGTYRKGQEIFTKLTLFYMYRNLNGNFKKSNMTSYHNSYKRNNTLVRGL